MRKKKIRGYKRRWKDIENWRLDNLDLNLTDYLLNEQDRYSAKIRVHPWSGISVTNSVIIEPRGATKCIIINILLDIYDDWKKQLDQLGQPYYLKIWLFEPRFSKSQVVCAIGDNIDYYENTFFEPETNEKSNLVNYGQLKNRLCNYSWDCRLDEDYYFNNEVGSPEDYATQQDYEEYKIWFEKLIKKEHRIYKLQEHDEERTEMYMFKRGYVWLGGQNIVQNACR